MATTMLRNMPPRGQELKTHRSVLKFKDETTAKKNITYTPVSVDRSKTPAQEAARWIANPEEWPGYVPSYEVWCAMTCSSGNYKKDVTQGSAYFTLRQLLLTTSPKGQITNGDNGTLINYLKDGKPKVAAQQPNTAKQVAESQQKEPATRQDGFKGQGDAKVPNIVPKYDFTGLWPKGPKVVPVGLIGLDTQVKMRNKKPNKGGEFYRVPHTYNIENQQPSSQLPKYHLEAVSSIMPYTKRQWTLNMGIKKMTSTATNTCLLYTSPSPRD